ncbi:hypothetical protein B0H19DRAFT_1310989 [Mycena capillaripes]|nr:hypothetical protein B0H19DRAFT_1310989 [Mycena capillaripes]
MSITLQILVFAYAGCNFLTTGLIVVHGLIKILALSLNTQGIFQVHGLSNALKTANLVNTHTVRARKLEKRPQRNRSRIVVNPASRPTGSRKKKRVKAKGTYIPHPVRQSPRPGIPGALGRILVTSGLMHDALHLRNVSKLPSSFRSTALAAANGSLDDLSKVSMALTYPPLSSSPSVIWLLPVLYLHIDPGTIPTPDEVDSIVANATRLPCIDAACEALKALGLFVDMPVFPHDVAPDLWLRVWPWMHFIHTYWQYLPGFDAKAEISACLSNSFLVAKLRVNEKVRNMTTAQAGLRVIFSRAWTAILLENGLVEQSDIYRQSGRLLPTLTDGLNIPRNFEEVLDGAGCSLDRLATAILKQISLALADTRHKLTPGGLTISVAFLHAKPERNTEWVSLLLSRGIVVHAVSALHAFNTSVTPDVLDSAARTINTSVKFKVTPTDVYFGTIKACFEVVTKYLVAPPGYAWIAEAIEAGLLRCLISFAAQGSRYNTQIQLILGRILPLNLVSRSVITQMKKALAQKDVQEISGSRQFMPSPLFPVWKDLLALVKTRVRALDSWETTGGLSFMACDNMLCGKITQKRQFKRCAGCRSANYCSSNCQSVDWRDGHRAVCEDLRAVRCQHPEISHPRERFFIRALMHYDYQKLLFEISIREVLFLRDHPGEEYIVVFDYTKPGGVKFQVDPKPTLPNDTHLRVEFPVQWERLARSGGRMKMHIMYATEGIVGIPRVIPLRAASAEFHQGLLDIARSTSFEPNSAEEEWHDEEGVRALIAKTKARLVEIH